MKPIILNIIEGGCLTATLTNLEQLGSNLLDLVTGLSEPCIPEEARTIISTLPSPQIEILDWDNVSAGDDPELSPEALALLDDDARSQLEAALRKNQEQDRLDTLGDGNMKIVEG